MKSPREYVLVTPVRNEERTIGRTIESVVSQTVRPVEWVIASDGSTDSTHDIIRDQLSKHRWIRLLELPQRDAHCFSAVVVNTMVAISYLESKNHAYIGLLDADVEFDSNYYESVMRYFERDPMLGLAGGVVLDPGESREKLPRNRIDIPGAVQFYRKECFDSIGGLMPIPEGGWDGVACVMARMAGYRTRLLSDLVVNHLKPRNVSQGGVLKRSWQMGIRDRAVGYQPWFEFFKCLSRVGEAPWFARSIAWWCGYLSAWLSGNSSIVPKPVRDHLHREHVDRIRRIFSLGKIQKNLKISNSATS